MKVNCSVLLLIPNGGECYFRCQCLLDGYSMQSYYEHDTQTHWFTWTLLCADLFRCFQEQSTFRIREQWDVVKYSDTTTKEYVKLKQRMVEEENLFIYSSIYLFVYLFIHSFINVFVFWKSSWQKSSVLTGHRSHGKCCASWRKTMKVSKVSV